MTSVLMITIFISLSIVSVILFLFGILRDDSDQKVVGIISIVIVGVLCWGMIGTTVIVDRGASVIPEEDIEIVKSENICFVIYEDKVYKYETKKEYSEIDSTTYFYYRYGYNMYGSKQDVEFLYTDDYSDIFPTKVN
jgi:hypothetical protein